MELLLPELVFAHVRVNTADEVLHFLANKLQVNGKVKNTFENAVMKREKIHPTGLPSGKIAVAIPHTDVQFVIEAAIDFGTLDHPIPVHNMAETQKILDVQIVVMLALKDPHSQVKMLQKLMTLFQNQKLLSDLQKLTDSQELYQIVSKHI